MTACWWIARSRFAIFEQHFKVKNTLQLQYGLHDDFNAIKYIRFEMAEILILIQSYTSKLKTCKKWNAVFRPICLLVYIRCIIKPVNEKLAEKKWNFPPDLFTSILQVYSILVFNTSKLQTGRKEIGFFARLFY